MLLTDDILYNRMLHLKTFYWRKKCSWKTPCYGNSRYFWFWLSCCVCFL